MKRINRRSFVKATGALVAAPALAGLPVLAAQAQNTVDLRVDKDIVFGKGGDIARSIRHWFVVFLGWRLYAGFKYKGIDYAAHLGGLPARRGKQTDGVCEVHGHMLRSERATEK